MSVCILIRQDTPTRNIKRNLPTECVPVDKIKKVAELRKKSETTAAKQLAELKKKQLVEYRGANKTGGYYVK